MKTIVQIITQNQSNYIKDMIEATKDFERVWIADRCIDNTVEKLLSLDETVIVNNEGTGFLAGRMRDLGIDYILSKDYDVVIMLDGDRVPFNLTRELVENDMKDSDCSLGFCENDMRKTCFELMFKEPYESVITAGLIVKTNSLRKVRRISFMNNRCFHNAFDGEYGEEDYFFGDCLFVTGAIIKFSDLRMAGTMPSSNAFLNVSNGNKRIRLKEKLGLK